MSIFCFILLGYFFNNQSEAGGNPLRIYEITGKSMADYASLSNS